MSPEQRPFDRLGVVAVLIRQGRFLVIRRSQLVVAPRAYCFPGGAIEPGESEEEALVRELREELGVAIRPVRHLWRSTTPWNVRLSWWLAELDPQAEPQPNPAEVESVHWYTSAEMRQLPELLESNRHFLDALARQEIELAVDGA
jgi:NADH pyrophosphatase NudC (nudix superfamily)